MQTLSIRAGATVPARQQKKISPKRPFGKDDPVGAIEIVFETGRYVSSGAWRGNASEENGVMRLIGAGAASA